MVKLLTNYKKAISAFNLYGKCFKGQQSMDQIKKANKLMRRIREEILIDVETALDVKRKEITKETNERKKRELSSKFKEESEEVIKQEIGLDVMPEEVEALTSHFDGIKSEDLTGLETNLILEFDAFCEDLKNIKPSEK